MDKPRMTPRQIMAFWETTYRHKLTVEQQQSFLEKEATALFAVLPGDVARAAIAKEKKLADALLHLSANRIQEARSARASARRLKTSGSTYVHNTKGVRTRSKSKKSSPKRTRRRRAKPVNLLGRLDAASGMSGQSGGTRRTRDPVSNRFPSTSEQYAGAMRKTRREATPTYRCGGCGARVPDGTAHDC